MQSRLHGDVHDASRERKDLYWPEVMIPTLGMLMILLYSYFSSQSPAKHMQYVFVTLLAHLHSLNQRAQGRIRSSTHDHAL